MKASSTRACAAMCATGVAASLFLTAPLTAQNGPRGRLVVAAEGSSERGVGGGFLVEPTGTGQRPVPITGLPPEFTGEPLDGTANGAHAVCVAARTQEVTFGSSALPGDVIELLRVTLRGATATVRDRITIGTNRSPVPDRARGIEEIEELPDGSLVVTLPAAVELAPGILAQANTRIVRVSFPSGQPPRVEEFPVVNLPIGDVTGVGFDDTRDQLVFAVVGSTTTTLIRTPRSGGLATVIAQLPGIVATGLTVDVAGLIDIAHGDEILQVNPDTGATETVRSNVLEVSAVARSAGDRIAMLRRHPNGARNVRVSTMRSRRRNSGFNTLTSFRQSLGVAADLCFTPEPPAPPPPPRPTGNPGGNVLVAALGSSTNGRGGVFLVNPTRPNNPPVRVEGLPNELTGVSLNAAPNGASAVFVRRSDQTVFIGETVNNRDALNLLVRLFRVSIQGDRATVLSTTGVGRLDDTNPGLLGGVTQIDELPDGRLILSVNESMTERQGTGLVPLRMLVADSNGAIRGSGRFNLGSNPPAGDYRGVVVDRATGDVFFIVALRRSSGGITDTRLFRVSADGGTPTQVALVVGVGALGLTLDNDGDFILATAQGVIEIDRATQAQRTLTTQSAVAVANAAPTDQLVIGFANSDGDQVASFAQDTTNPSIGFLTPTGTDLGTIRDAQLLPSPHLVASGTPGTSAYTWAVAPNPGGMAFVGNATFSLTLRSDSGALPLGVVFLGPNRISQRVAGVLLGVDPFSSAAIPIAPVGGETTIPLPVPNDPGLGNARLFAQGVLVEANAELASSDVVVFRVL